MPRGIYIFGGSNSQSTWEWFPSGTNQWQSGNTKIIGKRFDHSFAFKINDTDVLLIGGLYTSS